MTSVCAPQTIIRTTLKRSANVEHRSKLSKHDRVRTELTLTPKKGHNRQKSAGLDGTALPCVQSISSLDKDYQMMHLLGQGVSSQVFLAKNKHTHEYVAVKMIPQNLLFHNLDLAREIGILKQTSHRYIIGLKDVLITEKYLQIIMEAAQGQELFDEICSRRKFTETETKDILFKLLDACNYLHRMGIVHRDLKPENIIFMEENGNQTLKIIDFGFAKKSETQDASKSAGTLGYKAPEIMNGQQHTTKADMWSLGVITYILLVGFPPFFSYEEYKDEGMLMNAPFWSFFNDETELLLNSIKEGKVEYPEAFWRSISSKATDFVKSLLKVVPEERLSAEEALNHSWFTSVDELLVEVVWSTGESDIICSDNSDVLKSTPV